VTAVAPERRPRLSVLGWSAITASVLAVVAVIGLVLTLVTVAKLSDARAALADRIDPAIAAAYQLDAALVDQETGVRGYLLGRQDQFLQPYRNGVAVERRKLGQLDRLVTDEDLPGLRRNLASVAARTKVWRNGFAMPAIDAVGRGKAAPGAVRVSQGKASFDALRGALGALQRDLGAARVQARSQLRDYASLVSTVVWSSSIVLLLALALAAWGLRRQVITPIGALAERVRRVAGGEFERPIHADGARDIVDLGADTEAMRARIVEEIREVERARAELDRQAQDLQRSNAELEQFAYVASHDLQEPLRKVASFCQMLERRYAGQLDERADQYIHYAVDGARRMQDLINDLLAFSRVGRMSHQHEPVDLNEILRRAESNLAARVEETGAEVEAGELPTVVGDAGLLALVFQNLVGNALKFHGEDPPRVRVAAERNGDGWQISVADNGIGIESEYAERIFVIFQRLHTRVTYEGTGIGLAMCRKIVEHHGGRIWLDTEAHPGTTFRFTLPDTEEPAAT
jgi:signal transduction histidine kinase